MDDHKQNAIDELEKAVAAAYDEGFRDGHISYWSETKQAQAVEGMKEQLREALHSNAFEQNDPVSESKRILWW